MSSNGRRRVRLSSRLAVRRGEVVQVRRTLLSQTWLWFALFVVAGTLLITPGSVDRYPLLAAGEVAPADIVVRQDITLPDRESTEQKHRRATQEVLPVWVMDPGVAPNVEAKLERVFRAGREHASGSDSELATRLSEASGLAVTPAQARVLRRAKFSEDLLAALRETVSRLYKTGVASDRLRLLQSSDNGIVVRTAGTDAEHVDLDVYRFIDGSSGLAEVLDQRLATEEAVHRAWRAPLAAMLAEAMPPNLLPDRGETLARQLRAASEVEEVSIRLPRGKVLVRRGDEVSPQTARLLAALAARTARPDSVMPALGVLLLVIMAATTWFFFLRRQSPVHEEFRTRFGSVVIVAVFMLLLERGFAFLAGGVAASVMREPFGRVDIYLPALPHAAGPILAGLMLGLPEAVLFAAVQGLMVALMVGGDAGVAIYAIASGVAAAFVSQRLKERTVFARVGVIVAAVNVVVIVGLALWRGTVDEGEVLMVRALAGAVGGLVAAALASFLVPVLESLTGTITDSRLLELSNPNLPLLKRMATEAPGTFQHSLAMANLAEAAAEAVGANPLLARVCCYYHDIGKLAKPVYFVENQRGDNPHDHLTPSMSSLVVSNHVKAGLELAREYRLPEPIREGIATHHGTKLIRYFYSRAKEQETADSGEVQETEYRYPGPKPQTKEMGILLLADAVEAASRTLQEPSPGKIDGMIEMIVKSHVEDGQLDDCDLTLKDVEKISAAFFWVLTNALHHRIDYPGFDFNRGGRRG